MNNPTYQNLIYEDDYFDILSAEGIYLDLKARQLARYVKEAEKIERNDSKITLHILLKEAAKKS